MEGVEGGKGEEGGRGGGIGGEGGMGRGVKVLHCNFTRFITSGGINGKTEKGLRYTDRQIDRQ